MRFWLPQVRGMQFGPRLPIATQNDDPQGGKLHAPHLRKKKPQVIQRNVLQTACAKSRRSRGSLSGSIFLLHTECPSGIYAHRHRSRGWLSTCGHVREGLKSRIHAQVSLTPLSHSGTFFFCHSTNLFVAGHPFGQNLPSICTSNPNEMVDFLICLTFSTKNCLSNT